MLVGERLRAARKERGMSLADLARATELSKGFISQVESGVSNPSLASLRKLTTALDLAPGGLLDETASLRVVKSAEQSLQKSGATEREGIKLHSLNLTGRGPSSGVVPIFANTQQGQAAIFTLALHESVLSRTSDNTASGVALCAVLEGTVRVERAGIVAVARQGEVASFHAGSPYELTNFSSRRTTFLLTLPFWCELPRRADVAHAAAKYTSTYSTAGPFRIVQMRAGRGERERGR